MGAGWSWEFWDRRTFQIPPSAAPCVRPASAALAVLVGPPMAPPAPAGWAQRAPEQRPAVSAAPRSSAWQA